MKKNKNCEINKKLNLENIDWAEVVINLNSTEKFTTHDVKRALKGTGRSFNANGPFYRVVREFIEKLGQNVKTEFIDGEQIFTIKSVDKALEDLGYREKKKTNTEKTKETHVKEDSVIKQMVENALKEKEIKYNPAEKEIIKIISPTGTNLRTTLFFVAIFIKENSTSVDTYKLREYFKDYLGYASNSVITMMASFRKIIKLCGSEVVHKVSSYPKYDFVIEGRTEPLDLYIMLSEIYKKHVGKSLADIDEFAFKDSKKEEELKKEKENVSEVKKEEKTEETNKPEEEAIVEAQKTGAVTEKPKKEIVSTVTEETKPENVKETTKFDDVTDVDKIIQEINKKREQYKDLPRMDTTEVKWKKWLLLEALKAKHGANSRISSLCSWVKSSRYEEIKEDEAKKYLRELQQDFKNSINFNPGEYVSTNPDVNRAMKYYHPTKFKETIYVKLNILPENMNNTFPEWNINVEDCTESRNYVYEIGLDRSFLSEIYLKKLIGLVQIQGKFYTPDTFMVNRVIKILEEEKRNRYSVECEHIMLEKINE